MNLFSLRTILALVFCFFLLVLPWAIGGNLPWVRTGLLVWVAIGLIACSLSSSFLNTPTRLGLTFQALLFVAIGYGAIQLVSIGGTSISQYPAATRAQLAVLILAVGIFCLSSAIFTDNNNMNWLFGLIALNSVLLTFFGLAQVISDTDMLYWNYELTDGGQMFGPFVNSNNAGGYLLMCFAAANFFVACDGFRSLQKSGPAFESATWIGMIGKAIGRVIAKVEARQMYILTALSVTAAGIFATLSRGASVALVVALFVGWGLLFRRNLTFAFVALFVVCAGVGLLAWTQQNEAIVVSLETISDEETNSGRLEHWQDGWNYAVDVMPFGSGLGTYNLMYLPYQERPFVKWYKYAENQYLQSFAELGIPGVILLLLLIMTAVIACSVLISRPDATSKAVGLTALMALVSQVVAGAFDFGLYMPANMYLLATIFGAVFGRLNWCWSASNVAASPPRGRIWMKQVSFWLLAVAAAWGAYEYSGVDARQSCRNFFRHFDPVKDREKIADYRKLAEYSTKIRPDDAQAHYQLALNYLLDYRIAASEAMVKEFKLGQQELEEFLQGDQITSAQRAQAEAMLGEPELTFDDAWPRSRLTFLHRLSRSANFTDVGLFEDLQKSEPVSKHLRPVWEQLNRAEQACDKFWNVPLALGQLSLIMDNGSDLEEVNLNEQKLIDTAVHRSRNNSNVLFVAAMVNHHSGHTQSACKLWNQCLSQTRKLEEGVIQICLNEISIKDFFEQVLPNDPYFRIRVIKKYLSDSGNSLAQRLLLDHTRQIVKDLDLEDAERNYLLGEIERLSKNYPIAVAYYKKALDAEPRVEWRIQMALALIEAKLYVLAIKELKVCELYPGKHQMMCQRLLNRAKRGQRRLLGKPAKNEVPAENP